MINNTIKNLKRNKIFTVVLLGLIVRILFYFFGAALYYGKENFFKGGDTNWWVDNIANLINYGVYTDELNTEYGYFTRLPGYSFFIGIFYLITGKNVFFAFKIIAWCQIVLDCFAIYLVYKISIFAFKNEKTAVLNSIIYAVYPFVFVWNVIVYAESLSVFLLLLSIFFLLRKETTTNYILSGILLGIGVLTRIQLIFLLPLVVFSLIIHLKKTNGQYLNKQILWFCIAAGMTYGTWPARNYLFHNKIIFTQHLGDKKHWAPDRIYFTSYLWSVKTDIEPQFSQVMKNISVEFPEASYKIKGDSIKLLKAVELMRNCGEGLSYFRESEKISEGHVEKGKDCNNEIVEIFKELINHQKENNKLNYYLWVPLNNLKKAIFKFSLTQTKKGISSTFINLLFLYRTFLILSGIAGLYILSRKKDLKYSQLPLITIGYSLSWYIFHSFYYRNMEIRYLLHCDILLLFPASYLFTYLLEKYFVKKTV